MALSANTEQPNLSPSIQALANRMALGTGPTFPVYSHRIKELRTLGSSSGRLTFLALASVNEPFKAPAKKGE